MFRYRGRGCGMVVVGWGTGGDCIGTGGDCIGTETCSSVCTVLTTSLFVGVLTAPSLVVVL